ncbi:hypothetical protein [Palleronia sp.]|uniref:hypothetical protein n=1 Tax=Palleronia sp. TaxID=1940284 RepID=UPI0035C829C2
MSLGLWRNPSPEYHAAGALPQQLVARVFQPLHVVRDTRGSRVVAASSSGSVDNHIRKRLVAAGLFTFVEVEVPETKKKKKLKKAARSQHGIRKTTAHELARGCICL